MSNRYKGFKFSIQRIKQGFNILIENKYEVIVMKAGPYHTFEIAFKLAIRFINENVWRIKHENI